MMAGLQRSAVSFRRQGSSGIVWDDKFLSGELNQLADQNKEDRNTNTKSQLQNREEDSGRNSPPPDGLTIERSRSNGGRNFRTGRVSPAIEPPSPKVSACGFCSAFGKSKKTHRRPQPTGAKRAV
ncbi:MAPK kinase substrate protein At1g80180-like [Andrographis paniculata]|uniref:MAPK kinase substrate protein At1g80180-like n=1 Tax=Andrographis paniculata TaxID=175694 RepID=UPI0021E766B1|nr:MAPK kinase substrate protein At1g80180-like [Andrographis paniculata]